MFERVYALSILIAVQLHKSALWSRILQCYTTSLRRKTLSTTTEELKFTSTAEADKFSFAATYIPTKIIQTFDKFN